MSSTFTRSLRNRWANDNNIEISNSNCYEFLYDYFPEEYTKKYGMITKDTCADLSSALYELIDEFYNNTGDWIVCIFKSSSSPEYTGYTNTGCSIALQLRPVSGFEYMPFSARDVLLSGIKLYTIQKKDRFAQPYTNEQIHMIKVSIPQNQTDPYNYWIGGKLGVRALEDATTSRIENNCKIFILEERLQLLENKVLELERKHESDLFTYLKKII